MKNQKYHISIRILHWVMAAVIISLLAVGFYMKGLDSEVSFRSDLYHLHKSFGALILFLIIFRVFFRVSKSAPSLPQTMSKIVQKLAHFVHYLLYLLMFAMPLSGYLMSNYFGYPVKLFFIKLPFLVEKNVEMGKLFSQIHTILGFVFVFVLILHICGVIKHRFFDKKENDVLGRML